MLMFMLALAVQDPAWAATVRSVQPQSRIQFDAELTGAQRDTCFETLDRIGATQQAAEAAEDKLENLRKMMTQARTLAPQGGEGRIWFENTEDVSKLLESELEDQVRENRRAAHALVNVSLTFCRTISPL